MTVVLLIVVVMMRKLWYVPTMSVVATGITNTRTVHMPTYLHWYHPAHEVWAVP